MSYRPTFNNDTNSIEQYLDGTVASTGVAGQIAYSKTSDYSSIQQGEGIFIDVSATAAANANLKGIDIKIGSQTVTMPTVAINGEDFKLLARVMEGPNNSVIFRDITGITDSQGYRADTIRLPKGSLFSASTDINVILNTTSASDLILKSVTVFKYEI